MIGYSIDGLHVVFSRLFGTRTAFRPVCKKLRLAALRTVRQAAATRRLIVIPVGNALAKQIFSITAIVVLVTAATWGGPSQAGTASACRGLEVIPDRNGLISQSRAEELATEVLGSSAPEVSAVQIESVRASCLTTRRSYQRDLLERNSASNPQVKSLETPIWIVEVEGVSRPEGISEGGKPYAFAMVIINAESGEIEGGSRRYAALLERAEEQ